MVKYNDYPIDECARALAERMAKGGCHFYQKFTCEQCGARITMDEQDKLFELGHCQDCGHETDIRKRGCNYMLLLSGKLP